MERIGNLLKHHRSPSSTSLFSDRTVMKGLQKLDNTEGDIT